MSKNKKKVNKVKTNNKNKRIDNVETSYKTDTKKVVICLLTVLVILGLTYLITVLIVNKSAKREYKPESSSIQYEEILLGTTFHKKDKEYLVLFYDVKDADASVYSDLISDYQAKDNSLPIYYVDLSNTMNKDCISAEANRDATNAQELKINDVTLIKFSSNEISEYLIGKEEITNYLNK